MAQDVYVPQLGDIGIVTIRGAGGAGIGWAERLAGAGRNAKWRHAFGVSAVNVGAERATRIVEAEPSGAREVSLAEYDPKSILWLRCPPQYGETVAAALFAMVGTGYSWADYAAVGLHRLHIPAPGLRAYVGRSNRRMCSQLVDLAAQRGGWQIFDDGRWPGFVIPSDLAAVAERQGVAV